MHTTMKGLVLVPFLLVLIVAGATAAGRDLRLIDAVKEQDVAAVRALLAQGVDVNATQGDGATALHWAVHHDATTTAALLIEAGAEVNATNELGVPPLLLACTNASDAMVEVLLAAGADPNLRQPGRETPLMTASWTGNIDVVTRLLARGADVNGAEDGMAQTALMWAVSERHPAIVQALVEHGADVHARTASPPIAKHEGFTLRNGRSANGFTPLLFAARVGAVESLGILLDAGANVDDTADDGLSAVALAAVRGHAAVVTLLLERGADPNAAGAGYTPLHWVAGLWDTELTVDDITTDREGEWRTIAGLPTGKPDLVKTLLLHGADPNARMEQTPERAGSSKSRMPELAGATPYLIAATAADTVVMRLLAETGADVNLTTTSNATPLMAAAGFGRVIGESSLRDTQSVRGVIVALELGAADINATDDVGNTALHYAAYHRQDAVVQYLVDQGASVDVKNILGETPLWVSELALQFSGGGTFQILRSSAGDLLRSLGAQDLESPPYDARPSAWPNNGGP